MKKVNDRFLAGYLTYVTDENKPRRLENFEKSLKSLELLKGQPCDILSIDNNSAKDVKKILQQSDVFHDYIFLDNNLYDVPYLFLTYCYAKLHGYSYMTYLYDDFIISSDNFMQDCLTFMESMPQVHCLRIPWYEFDNQQKFNARITPKAINPDAISHVNTATQKSITWSGPFRVGSNVFYVNDWHYTSRPTIWRTDIFGTLFDNLDSFPVMTAFEEYALNKLNKIPLVTGVLDGGAMRTVKQSERIHMGGRPVDGKIRFDKDKIYDQFVKLVINKEDK